jgi:PAS domain S-box-containing protein
VVGNAWATDVAGKFTYVTPAALSALGTTLEEINSDTGDGHFAWRRIIHPDDYDAAAALWRRCLRTGEHYDIEHRLLRPSGSYGWGRSTGQPLRDGEERITGWYGTVIDTDVRSAISKRLSDVTGSAPEEKAAPDVPRALGLIHPDDRDAAAHAAARAFWTGVPQVTRHRQLQPDASYRWTETRSEPGYSVSVDVDDLVTDREPPASTANPPDEHTSEAIKAAEVVESIFGNGWAFDSTGRWIYLHPFAQNSLGVTLEYLNAALPEGDTAWKRLLHPDDYEQVATAWRHCLATGDHFNVEFRFRRASGAYVWARTAARPAHDSEGHITGWFGIALDIDVYKKTMAALRDREMELSHLVDMVPSHIWRLDPRGEPTFFNKRMVDFLGATVADLDRPGMSRLEALAKFVHPDDAAEFTQALRTSIASGARFAVRYRQRRSDGAYRWMSSRAEPVRDQEGQILQWYGVCHDVDDQLQAEEALRNSKRQLEQMIDAVPFSILSFDPSRKMTYTSKRYLEQAGLPVEDIQDFDGLARDVVHPDDFPVMFQRAQEGFATGQPFVNRFRRRLSSGGYRWIEARAQPLRDPDGTIIQWYIASIDIEDEMRAQEALRARERFVWQLVETLPAMIDCAAPDGEPIYRSQQLREFLGYELEELDSAEKSRLTGTLDAGVHPDDVTAVKDEYTRSLSTGEPYARRHRLRRFDGEYRWVETRASPMRDAEGAIIQWNVICLDIDGEVRAQEALRLAQDRLSRASQAASLAELSASIAHEVNQPLAAIVANSYACHRWLSAAPPNIERAKITAERIIRDANSAADVVSRIRALFRQSTESRSSVAVATVIAEARDLMAEEALRRRIRLEVEVEGALPMVVLDRTQIQQVLVNLIRNGMEAMDGLSADKLLRMRAAWTAEGIRIEVSDHGRGLDDADKVFDPFFTTKPDGMGMGLAICRSIVESHGGRLWVERNQPRGAKFIFTLPVETKAAS